ncbi:MAG: hypothetical protein C5B47_00975, partial [Verrucomicrobia bacterium]
MHIRQLWSMAGIIFLSGISSLSARQSSLALLPSGYAGIGAQVWKNECAGTTSGLTSWNRGEDFASLGIGHFIW